MCTFLLCHLADNRVLYALGLSCTFGSGGEEFLLLEDEDAAPPFLEEKIDASETGDSCCRDLVNFGGERFSTLDLAAAEV